MISISIERVKNIMHSRDNGLTYAQLGEKYHLSTERTWQIVKWANESGFNEELNWMSGFSVRTVNILNKQNITTVNELISLTNYELINLPNAGIKVLNEIREYLKADIPDFKDLNKIKSAVALLKKHGIEVK